MLYTFINYFFLFFLYSIIGWISETTYVAIQEKKLVDRGFLIGPYCPIYGFGAIIMILYLTQYKNNILTVFILAMVLCSILEYFTSYIMEKLFKTRWWDYSDKKFNLNGRICGLNSLLFGIGGIIVIYLIQPLLDIIILNMNKNILSIISFICFIIYITDTIISCNVANKFKNTIINLNVKQDSTEEFSILVRNTLKENKKIFQSRLYKAFPNINFNKLLELKNDITEDIKEFTDDIKEITEDIKEDIKEFLNK